MMSSVYSNSDAETQNLDESEIPYSVATADWYYDAYDGQELEDYIRSQGQSGDVVDGGHQSERSVQPTQNTYFIIANESNRSSLPGPVSSPNVNVAITKLPEAELRVQKWVNDCSLTSMQFDENTSEAPNAALHNIDLFIKLCKDKLPKWAPKASMSDPIGDEKCSFDTIIVLLMDNNVPEAMMIIIQLICSQSSQFKTIEMTSMMLKILNLAVQSFSGSNLGEELDTTEIEKLMLTLGDIFNDKSQYFAPFTMDPMRRKVPVKNHAILEALEEYVNGSIRLALECRKTVFDVDFENMRQIVEDTNKTGKSFLSTEQQCNLAKKACTFVRKSIYFRCHNFLKDKGFDFGVLDCNEEFLSSLEQNTPEVHISEVSEYLDSQTSSSNLQVLDREFGGIQSVQHEQIEVNPIEIARTLFGEEENPIFYDDNAQANPNDESESVRFDSLGSAGYLSSPSYSLSIPRMSKSPTSSLEEEHSPNQLLTYHENSYLVHRLCDLSSSDGDGGFHSEPKRNRLD